MASIQARPRTGTGKGVARALRKEGRIPAVLYGAGKENENLTLPLKEFTLLMAAQGAGLKTDRQEMEIEGQGVVLVLLRDVQFHPVTGKALHADFLRFDADRRVEISVPVVVRNEDKAPGLKRGGILSMVRHQLVVHCKAGVIPHHIEISVEGMDIGDSVHVKELKLPAGVEVAGDQNATIIALVGVQAEEVGEGGETG
ncbi:MAG: 50S ribosomal protein L25/general stress protein Ctc [Magnetococcales bacterium]|nr:50S ribosomal protein L25/general stress protein Ctc [Magnetococcales bacterium]